MATTEDIDEMFIEIWAGASDLCDGQISGMQFAAKDVEPICAPEFSKGICVASYKETLRKATKFLPPTAR